jgi:hypothetical protein
MQVGNASWVFFMYEIPGEVSPAGNTEQLVPTSAIETLLLAL